MPLPSHVQGSGIPLRATSIAPCFLGPCLDWMRQPGHEAKLGFIAYLCSKLLFTSHSLLCLTVYPADKLVLLLSSNNYSYSSVLSPEGEKANPRACAAQSFWQAARCDVVRQSRADQGWNWMHEISRRWGLPGVPFANQPTLL